MDGVRLVRARALVGVASLGLAVLVGCSKDGGAKGAAANAGPYAKEVSEAVPKIERAVGLRFKTPPKVETRSKTEVRQFLEQHEVNFIVAQNRDAHPAPLLPCRPCALRCARKLARDNIAGLV